MSTVSTLSEVAGRGLASAAFRRMQQRHTPAMTSLSPDALLAVEQGVRAVVDHDDERLALLAPDAGDLYFWTRDYGIHGVVDLVLPPGPAEGWHIDSTDTDDGEKHVAVTMWTRQEGRSDLTLELHLSRDDRGHWHLRILDLHVL